MLVWTEEEEGEQTYAREIDADVAISTADVDDVGVLEGGPGIIVVKEDGRVVDCELTC